MTTSPFTAPASTGDAIQWEEHAGRLLLIEPISVEEGVNTQYGVKDAVRADITVIDAPGAPQEYPDVLIFPKVLVSQTKSRIGAKVLGRLGQGVAKPGTTQKPPWRLNEPTQEEVATGIRYLDSRKPAADANPFAAPATQPASDVPF